MKIPLSAVVYPCGRSLARRVLRLLRRHLPGNPLTPWPEPPAPWSSGPLAAPDLWLPLRDRGQGAVCLPPRRDLSDQTTERRFPLVHATRQDGSL